MPLEPILYGLNRPEDPSIVGVHESSTPLENRPDYLRLALNVCPKNPLEAHTPVTGRPGCTVIGAQLGTGGARTPELICQWTKTDGTELTIAWVGGKMYTLNWGTRIWTEVVHGQTVSATARIYHAVLANKIIFSDGVNKPFMWDGTTFTLLANAPVAYGRPAIYYAKVFFINAAKRNEFQWSEENDPTTGYAAGGFNNAWEITQTRAEGLYALVGTNEALYYFREQSAGAVRGAVTPDFRNDGTREGVSETVGTRMQPLLFERTIYFLDTFLRPYKIGPEGGLVPLWDRCTATSASARTANAAVQEKMVASVWYAGQMVLFSQRQAAGDPDNTQEMVFAGPTDSYWGTWTHGQATGQAWAIPASVKDGNLKPTLVHLSDDGYAYEHGDLTGTLWKDDYVAGALAIPHTVQWGMGYATAFAKHFEMLRFTCSLETALASNSLQVLYYTPLIDAVPFAFGAIALPATSFKDRQFTVGLQSALGRWLLVIITHTATGGAGERFTLMSAEVLAYPDAPDPAVT